jgi:hypothetical protein
MGTDLPQARVVRKGGQHFAPPPAPRMRREPGAIHDQLRTMAAFAIGMWPLTAVMLLATGFLIMVGYSASP